MARAVVCIAPGGRLSRRAASAIAAFLPGAPVTTRSLSGYLASSREPSRIVLCPAGASLARDLEFLRRAARRLLWPSPTSDFHDAIGGLRTDSAPPRPARLRPAPARSGDTASAVLLEGRVDAARARAVLAAGLPRDWIVESPSHVALSPRMENSLRRAGVRWSALEPVEVVALYAGPALARERARWRSLLPAGTPVWLRA